MRDPRCQLCGHDPSRCSPHWCKCWACDAYSDTLEDAQSSQIEAHYDSGRWLAEPMPR